MCFSRVRKPELSRLGNTLALKSLHNHQPVGTVQLTHATLFGANCLCPAPLRSRPSGIPIHLGARGTAVLGGLESVSSSLAGTGSTITPNPKAIA